MSHPRCVLIAVQDGAAPPPPFTLTYHKDPTSMSIETEVETTTTLKLGGHAYVRLTTKSTGHHKLTVHNGEQQQSNVSYGYTDLDDTALQNLYNIIGDALDGSRDA